MSSLTKNGSNAISGFYYDQQLKNRAMIMTLHANMEPTDIPPLFWKPWEGDKITDDADVSLQYGLEPIATAIVTEDFNIGISNQWDGNSLVDDATQLFNSLKSFAPISKRIAPKLREIAEKGRSMEGTAETDLANNAISGANKAANWLAAVGEKATEYLNRAVVVQGSRFVMYNGTGVAFGNMSMKFTLFSDWNEYGQWVSCIDKVKGNPALGVRGLTRYCIGKYTTLDSETGELKNSEWNKFIGWQIPPGGFKADLTTVDNIQEGTLKLIIGGIYVINNLVIQDAQFTFSKQLVKRPIGITENDIDIDISPMYCDVQLTLSPATKYTDKAFDNAIEGLGNGGSRNTYTTMIKDRLKALKG